MSTGTAVSYRVFVRNWWRWEHSGHVARHPFSGAPIPQKVRVPDPGARKTTLAKQCTEEEALALCRRYNETHNPGPLSRKAEYERE